ncbi:MAG: hypothetical protein ABSA43_01935 [Candidatus Microgenomates bacterium]
MNNIQVSKNQLLSLYSKGKSMAEISSILKCSNHKIVYWMDKYNIKRRNRSEASYIKQNPNGDPFKIKQKLNDRETFLLGLTLGIYWGEGNKSTPHSLSVTNTDSGLLRTYIRFLIDICQVKLDKIKYYLICFNDSDPEQAKAYWSQELRISPSKFGKIVQISPQGKGTYKKKSKYGVCSVAVSNIKLKKWFMEKINEQRHAWVV